MKKRREGYFAEGVQNMKDQIAQKERINKVKERKLQVHFLSEKDLSSNF